MGGCLRGRDRGTSYGASHHPHGLVLHSGQLVCVGFCSCRACSHSILEDRGGFFPRTAYSARSDLVGAPLRAGQLIHQGHSDLRPGLVLLELVLPGESAFQGDSRVRRCVFCPQLSFVQLQVYSLLFVGEAEDGVGRLLCVDFDKPRLGPCLYTSECLFQPVVCSSDVLFTAP